MFFDSHAHINNGDMTPAAREAVAEAIEASAVDYVTDIGFDTESSRLAAEHASRYPWCYAAAGCHKGNSPKEQGRGHRGNRP